MISAPSRLFIILSAAGVSFGTPCGAFAANRRRRLSAARGTAISGGGRLFAAPRDAGAQTTTRRQTIGAAAATAASLIFSATPPAQAAAPDALVELLVPIVEMNNELEEVQALVKDRSRWPRALEILQNPKYDKPNFKKTFNAFGDNVGNVGGGGSGSAPKTEQSMAYLLRNDLLTNVENLAAELVYLIKNEDDAEDLYKYADGAVGAMQKYLRIAPVGTVDEARKRLSK